MKFTLAIAALFLLASTTVLSQSASSSKATKHPVETFFMSGIDAFNAHNLDEFMKQFADDLEMYTPTGWLRGKEAVRQRFVETFKQFPEVRMEISDLRVREVARDVALVEFNWRTFPKGTGPFFQGVGSGAYVRRNGRWVEVLEHETIVRVDDGGNNADR